MLVAFQVATTNQTHPAGEGVPLGSEPVVIPVTDGLKFVLQRHRHPPVQPSGGAGAAPAPSVDYSVTAVEDGVPSGATCTRPDGATAPASAPAGGDAYPAGTTTVTCQAAGTPATVALNVVVTDSNGGPVATIQVLPTGGGTTQGGASSGQPDSAGTTDSGGSSAGP